MRIDNVKTPLSSFLSVEKDLDIILTAVLQNERLKRLLHYTTPDCLRKPNLSQEESLALVGKNIKIVPKLYIDEEVLNYLFICFDSFTPSSNPQFRDNLIMFDIVCHYDQWHLNDLALRPYKIAAEIDSMFNGKYLTGIGRLEFVGASTVTMTDEYGCLCMIYQAVHGEEDKTPENTQEKQEQFEQDFKDLIENGYSLGTNGRN